MGGQTALNVAMKMYEKGMLEGVEFLGANPEAINKGEDRSAFKEAMLKIGMDLPFSMYAYNMDDALEAANKIGFPMIIRASFTLAGGGSGVAYNMDEFKKLAARGLDESPVSEILIEESLLGWKEYEMEVIRDKADNCIIVCSIENFDPMGVHTGDSITVAPALTLTDKEYQRMRDASFAILREIGVDTGGSNVQFSIDPKTGRMIVIEMNPRVSRSSALASKATGYPIAKVATLLAVGFTLDEITNDITGTPAAFEPVIDYIVTKIPRFTFEKFPEAENTLSTSMKSVGEVMAIGRTFKESIQKALCSLETNLSGFDEIDANEVDPEKLMKEMCDLLYVVFGSKYKIVQTDTISDIQKAKCELIEQYITPIGLKALPWKEANNDLVQCNKITEQIIKADEQPHLECILPAGSYTSLHQNVYGLRIIFRNDSINRMVTINGLIKNIPIQFIKSNLYIQTRLNYIIAEYDSSEQQLSRNVFERWVDSLTIKDLLVFSVADLMKMFNSIQNDVNYVKHTGVEKIIKHFFDMDLISRRKMLINLILYNTDNEVQYIAYMLYDLIGSADACDGSDTFEQRKIYESLSWMLKQFFKETMVNTIEFTQDSISSGNDTGATLEQKVLLLRANDKVRDKAMAKLKEVKGKSDDQASKSKQYLEGLVKIPFGNYRKEPILCKIDNLNSTFKNLHSQCNNIEEKQKYTLYEITNHTNDICQKIETTLNCEFQTKITKMKKAELQTILECFTQESKTNKANILATINAYLSKAEKSELMKLYEKHLQHNSQIPFYRTALTVHNEIQHVETEMKQINEYLDESIYGHENAKKQILKIMGQWINGEQKGYCFGDCCSS